MNARPSQRGAAVLVAMLVLFLCAAAVAQALQRHDFSLRRLESTQQAEQARWLLRGAVHWARFILEEDGRAGQVDHQRELWAGGLAPTQVEDGVLSGRIVDAQGLFNLANLLRDGKPSEPDLAALRRLLPMIGLRPQLAEGIAALLPIADWSELSRAPGMDEAALARLARHAVLLPDRTPLNVNTAAPEVLASTIDGLGRADAALLAQDARRAPFTDVAAFRARLPGGMPGAELSVGSRYFLVEGRVVLGKADLQMRALLRRDGAAPLPGIVWQRSS